MKIYYKTIDHRPVSMYPFEYRKIQPENFCCEEMKSAWHEYAVGFGDFDNAILNDNNKVNIYRCHPFPEGACWDEYAINYCPFCGEKIEVIEKEVVKKK